MKKFLSIALTIILAVSLTACGDSRVSAEKAVETTLTAIKEVDLEKIGEFAGEDYLNVLTDDSSDLEETMDIFVKKFSYKILESTEEEDTATVKVEMTNVNMQVVIAALFQQLMVDALESSTLPEDQQPSQEELNTKYIKVLNELLDGDDVEMVTNTVDISLNYIDDEWQFESSDEILDSMLGGLLSSAESMMGF